LVDLSKFFGAIILVQIKCGDRQFNNIQAVIFDKDGTLVNSANFWRELGIKRARLIDAQIPGIGEPLLMAFGIQDDYLDPTGLMAVGSRYENEIASAAYIAETGRGWLESLSIAKKSFQEADQFLQNRSQEKPLFSGVLDCIKAFSESGLKIGIISADTTANIKIFIEQYHLSNYVQFGLGSDPEGFIKPDPRLFIQTCQSLAVAPEHTLMVGDAEGDIIMAKQANAAGAIGICWGQPQAVHLRNADVAIADLNQLSVIS
jgi:phosphoglycolate phosphatase